MTSGNEIKKKTLKKHIPIENAHYLNKAYNSNHLTSYIVYRVKLNANSTIKELLFPLYGIIYYKKFSFMVLNELNLIRKLYLCTYKKCTVKFSFEIYLFFCSVILLF